MLFPLWYCILIDSILYPMIKSIVSLLIRGWYFPCNHLGSSWAVILTCYRVHKCVVVITLNCAIPLGNFRELNWMVSGFSFPFQGLIANHLYIDGNVSDSGRVFFFFFCVCVCVGGGELNLWQRGGGWVPLDCKLIGDWGRGVNVWIQCYLVFRFKFNGDYGLYFLFGTMFP